MYNIYNHYIYFTVTELFIRVRIMFIEVKPHGGIVVLILVYSDLKISTFWNFTKLFFHKVKVR